MCRPPNTPMEYKNAELMNDLNEFMVCVKLYLHTDKIISGANLTGKYPKPSVEEIDAIHQRVHRELQKDAKPFIKY